MISFTIYGKPEPQGSMKAFIPKGARFPVVTSDNKKLAPWRQQVARTALDEMAKSREGRCEPFSRETPICIRVDFFLARPMSLPKRAVWPVKKPDFDKLCRGLVDALTGIVYVDDSQVVQCIVAKWYGSPERTKVSITVPKGTGTEANEQDLDLFAALEPAIR